MGAGKSTVGRALSEQLKLAFEDLDDRIEREQGRSIAELFRASGEKEFRRLEQAALAQLLNEPAGRNMRIIGLGGGAFVQAENAALLKTAGVITVFLDSPVQELWRRCVKQAKDQGLERPLLHSKEQFQTLYEKRRSSYLKASLRIETGRRTVAAIAREIAEAVGLKNLLEKEG
jgi:shikimate kinase